MEIRKHRKKVGKKEEREKGRNEGHSLGRIEEKNGEKDALMYEKARKETINT